jgi:hypothetical protein
MQYKKRSLPCPCDVRLVSYNTAPSALEQTSKKSRITYVGRDSLRGVQYLLEGWKTTSSRVAGAPL